MERISEQQMQYDSYVTSGTSMRADLWDVAGNSFEDAFISGPTAAITRAAKSYFDTSADIDANAANEEFGLAGTDAAFKEGEKVTVDRAKAVSDDYYRNRINNIVAETVREDSNLVGVTQFAASMAAGFVDPATLAANIGGAYVAGAAGRALLASRTGFNVVQKASPMAGRFIQQAYTEGAKRSLTAIVAREGLENVIGGVVEEGIIRGMDVGEERLAVKTDWTDSMRNIIAGTFLGTGIGVGVSKEGRNAIAAKFGRLFGDDAPNIVKTEKEIAAIEAGAGLERSHFEKQIYEEETYAARPWHGEEVYRPTDTPNEMYISVDADGVAYRPDHLGRGTVLHDNINMAYNKGERIIKVNIDNMRIARDVDVIDAKGRHTKLGMAFSDQFSKDVASRMDQRKVSEALALLDDPDVDIGTVPTLNRNQIVSRIKEKLDGKNIDEMMGVIDELGIKQQISYDPVRSMNTVLETQGWNGYQYSRTKQSGDKAYNGVYVLEKFNKKLQKSAEVSPPKANAGDLAKHKFKMEQMHLKYADWQRTAKPLSMTTKDAAAPRNSTPDTNAPAPKNEMQESIMGSIENKELTSTVRRNLEDTIAKSPDNEDAKLAKKLLDEIESGKDRTAMIEQTKKAMEDYNACKLGT